MEENDGIPPLPDHLPSGATQATEQQPTPGETVAEHEASIQKQESDLPEIEDTLDFLAKPIPSPKVLIEGLLHQGSKMIVGSGSKSFKTWVLLDLGISVASGTPWLGNTTTKGKVLFVNFELKDISIQFRINAVKQEKNLTWEKGWFEILNLRGYAAPYNTIIYKILERVKTRRYDLIILDPIYKLYGDTDENSAGDVAKLMNELERLAVKTKAAVVFSAHFSKGNQAGKDSLDRVSGSGVFSRDLDTILNFTKHEEDESFVVEATVRDFKQPDPFVVSWVHPVMLRNNTLNPKKLRTALSKKPTYTVKDLIHFLAVEK